MNTVEIKLVINGKEAIATLQLTDENVQKMANHLNELGQKGANSVELIRQRYAALAAMMENVPLGSKEFEELSIMTANARKELDAAEAMMQKSTGTTGNARMAVVSFSQTLSDSTQFQNGFRFGMMAISNNLEQMFGALSRVKAESAATGQTMMKSLVGALTGPAGVMIALSSVLLLLQILPGMFDKNTQKVEEFSLASINGTQVLSDYGRAIQNIQKEVKDLSIGELKDKIIEIEAQIKLSTDRSVKNIQSWSGVLKSFLNQQYGLNLDLTGGEGERSVLLEKTRKIAEEDLANRSRVKILEDEINDLKEAQNKKGTDLAKNIEQIELKERQRTELLKSTNERLEEQASVTIRLQRAQVDSMQEGYEKQRALASVVFSEAKAELDQELREKKISQTQYTEFLSAEESKRNNDYKKIEQDKNRYAIDVRTAALRRMSEMESSEVLFRINLDERIALSKVTSEQDRLRITKEYAIKRVEAEATAQQAILEIERRSILEKMKGAEAGSKDRLELSVQLDSNDDAFQKLLDIVQQKKVEIEVEYKITGGPEYTGGRGGTPVTNMLGFSDQPMVGNEKIIESEKELRNLQIQYANEVSVAKRTEIAEQIQFHQNALEKMKYSESEFAQDVYSGFKDLYGQVAALISQNIQQHEEAKIRGIEDSYAEKDAKIQNDREAALNALQLQREEDLAATRSSTEKDRINKSFNAQKLAIEKQYAAQSEKAEQDKENEIKRVKIEAFNSQKKFSYATAIINIAEGITRIMATVPPPFNIPLIALNAATGAIQLATIAGSKPPGLKDGGLFSSDGIVRGPGGPKDDAVNARLSNGEFVVNANATARNIRLLEALNAGKISSRFADEGLYNELRKAERTTISAFSGKRTLISSGKEVNQMDTSRIERKLEEVVDAIKSKEFAAYINRKKITEEIELQQRLNEKGKF